MEGPVLRWRGLLPAGEGVILQLGQALDLQEVTTLPSSAHADGVPAGYRETEAATELRRSIARAGSSGNFLTRLQRVVVLWKRSKRGVALIEPLVQEFRVGPRLFVDRVGCHEAELSWQPLGENDNSVQSFEVETMRFRTGAASGRERAGLFLVPGGSDVRSFNLRRLEPERYYYARVRALGPAWQSDWSGEVSFKTLSVNVARDAGHHFTANGFLIQSERRIAAGVGQPGDAALAPNFDDLSVNAMLNAALGPAGPSALKDLLDARSSNGVKSFVQSGSRYSQPAEERDQRMRRLRLVIAAQECYDEELVRGNPWSMGPFYYESNGLSQLQAAGS